MEDKKYEFTGETKEWRGVTLRRIRAAKDFVLANEEEIHKGDLGGWIEKGSNLSHENSAWVFGDAKVLDNAKVYGDAEVYGDAVVYGNAQVYGNAKVYGNAEVFGNAGIFGNARVRGDARVCDNAWVHGNARVHGNAWVYGDVKVCGNAEVYGTASVYGNARVYDNAMVSGDALVCGDAKVIQSSDVIWFKNIWSSGRTFTYTRSNGKWKVGCFHGTGEELIEKAYADSEVTGKCYEATVKYVEEIYKAIDSLKTNDISKGKEEKQ